MCGGALVLPSHSELPGEDGLELWREWSKLDSEYSNDWEHGDPCADRWDNFDSGKGIGFGSLVKLADEFDPERARFRRDGCEQLISEIEAQTLQVKTVRLTYEDVSAAAWRSTRAKRSAG